MVRASVMAVLMRGSFSFGSTPDATAPQIMAMIATTMSTSTSVTPRWSALRAALALNRYRSISIGPLASLHAVQAAHLAVRPVAHQIVALGVFSARASEPQRPAPRIDRVDGHV